MKYIVFYSRDLVDGEDYAEFSNADMAAIFVADVLYAHENVNFMEVSA